MFKCIGITEYETVFKLWDIIWGFVVVNFFLFIIFREYRYFVIANKDFYYFILKYEDIRKILEWRIGEFVFYGDNIFKFIDI